MTTRRTPSTQGSGATPRQNASPPNCFVDRDCFRGQFGRQRLATSLARYRTLQRVLRLIYRPRVRHHLITPTAKSKLFAKPVRLEHFRPNRLPFDTGTCSSWREHRTTPDPSVGKCVERLLSRLPCPTYARSRASRPCTESWSPSANTASRACRLWHSSWMRMQAHSNGCLTSPRGTRQTGNH